MSNKKTIWQFFVDKYRFTLLLVFFLVIFGFVSAWQMPRESMPEVEIPYAVVLSVYPGASAEDVEELVTQPLEDKIRSLDEIEEIVSTSKNSMSMIYVQFYANSDAQEKINDLKDKVDEVKGSLPEDAEEPSVTQINLDDSAILTFSISGPYSRAEIRQYADDIKDQVEAIQGVSKVDIVGGQEEEIKVVIDKAKLDNYGLSLSQINSAISAANSDIPVGSIESSGVEYTVRFSGQLSGVEDVKMVPLDNISETPILLKDVANVYDGYTDLNTMARLSKGGAEATTAVSLNVYRISGADITDISNNIKAELAGLTEVYPEDLNFDVSNDSGQDINDDLGSLLINGLETVIIVIVLLFLFLGWREALLTGLSVPMTFLITFIFLDYFGYTLNFLTLFSLILSLGILVDNAIVISEGIYVYLNKGLKIKEACLASVKEFQWTLTAGTLTTVFAFLPLLTVSGIVGKFMTSIPVTVTVVLSASLFVALGLIPTLATLFLKEKSSQSSADANVNGFVREKREIKNWQDRMMDFLNEKYDAVISNLLSDKKKGNKLLKFCALALVLSLLLPISGVLKTDMFPAGSELKVYLDFTLPFGTPLETTSQKITEIEQVLLNDADVESFLVNIGTKTSGGSVVSADSSGNGHYAGIVVNLKDGSAGSKKFIEKYSQTLKEIGGFEYELNQEVMGPPSSDPISISVSGDSLEELNSVAEQIKEIVSGIPGTRSVRLASEESPGEFVLEVDRVKAQIYGISTVQIASTLRSAVSGVDATVIRNNGEEIDVLVKYDLDGVNDGVSNKQIDLKNIEAITISGNGGDIPISSFVNSRLGYSHTTISHNDGERVVEVVGDVENGFSAQDVFDAAKKEINKLNLPDGYIVSYGGQDEDMQESFTDIFKALLIGLVLIVALLVLQFNSFKQSMIVLVTVPLALIGVLPGLVIMGQSFSFPCAIGVVALSGIVVKNAIIMIEKINMNIRGGMELQPAIKNAGSSRMRPIILTTITTVLGMFPLAISDATWGPLGYAIIFGLSFSTILTLFVLPVMYYKFSKAE